MGYVNRNKYLSDYHDQGYAFAPLIYNSLGQLGPVTADQSHLHVFKRLRGHIYVQSTYKLLAALFEGVTERMYGRT